MTYPYQPNGDPNQNAPWNMPPQPPPDQWQPQPGPGQPEQPGYGPPASGPPGYGPPDQPGYGPPDQPGYGPPASGPPGYPTQPYSAPPPYGPPSGPPDMYGAAGPPPGGPEIPGMPGGPQPPKKSRAPLVTMLVLGVVFVLGVGVSLFLILGDDTTETTTSGKTSPVEESQSPSPSESTSEPDPTPTDDPGGDSTFTGTLDEADYNDWNFKIGDVSLSAEKVDGWNYDDCTEIEKDGALTDLGCKEAIEIAYEAEDGEMKLDLVLMVMEDESSASALESDFDDSMYSPQKAGFIADFDFGKFRIGNESNIGVLTMGTATSAVDEADADEYLSYMFTDHKSALLFM
ncbi:MAG TPA: hypothetical protein H9902_03585 [Candidatus Stackebrandtia faecavium]|nr:hypothetical protein [Candidatus Stackebrandtia faecavium]